MTLDIKNPKQLVRYAYNQGDTSLATQYFNFSGGGVTASFTPTGENEGSFTLSGSISIKEIVSLLEWIADVSEINGFDIIDIVGQTKP